MRQGRQNWVNIHLTPGKVVRQRTKERISLSDHLWWSPRNSHSRYRGKQGTLVFSQRFMIHCKKGAPVLPAHNHMTHFNAANWSSWWPMNYTYICHTEIFLCLNLDVATMLMWFCERWRVPPLTCHLLNNPFCSALAKKNEDNVAVFGFS